MKINVNGYEVEITAKTSDIDATPLFLNYLSIALRNSSYYNRKGGYNALANHDMKVSDELFDICYKAGLYEG